MGNLKIYYNHVFPYKGIEAWLGETLQSTEFMFKKNDIMTRYQSFDDAALLLNKIQTEVPDAIHIGAAWDVPPRISRMFRFPCNEVVSRWPVVDIDMKDYAAERTCRCSSSKACPICIKNIGLRDALKVISVFENFGLEKNMVFFSGKKGIHIRSFDKSSVHFKNSEFRQLYNAVAETGVLFDKDVSVQPGHCLRCPFSPNGTTVCLPLSVAATTEEINEYFKVDVVNTYSKCETFVKAKAAEFVQFLQ